uniref:Glucose-methanol-choline oxidoreductase N-terminal domain-containing protein n=1 Tax=Moniliophthora roreri TaxID=221103 RepID=A0A0W0EZR6_MONRR
MPLVSLDQVKGKSFDYIITGGGTAGLVLAARLSEDSSTTVLVLDAGNPNHGEPLILRPGQFGLQFFNPKFDWDFKTVPQKHADGNQYNWNRGKSLGGSSAINFSAWIVPPKSDIDDWERLGNRGWNWENYEKYILRAVTYTPLDLTADTIGRDKEALKIWDINKYPPGTG